MNEGPDPDVYKPFFALALKSPPAIIALGFSAFWGYGISFILFDYRRAQVHRSHYLFHVAMGLGFAALMFCLVNYDLLSRKLTMDQLLERLPITCLVSFVVAFVICLGGAIWRQRIAPYAAGDGDAGD